VRLLDDLAKTHASFDDPNLVSRAALVPVMALAERAGLGGVTLSEGAVPGGRDGGGGGQHRCHGHAAVWGAAGLFGG
jgi:hypothetical protein